jgi:recombinational DNA repair ATPase RecF
MDFGFQVLNFASFDDSGPISIREGVNGFIGINNAGKTALLEALCSLPNFLALPQEWNFHQQNKFKGYLRTDVAPASRLNSLWPGAKRTAS